MRFRQFSLLLLSPVLWLFAPVGVDAQESPNRLLSRFRHQVDRRVSRDQSARIALQKFLGKTDQRQRQSRQKEYERLATRASNVDEENLQWLKDHVSEYGFPSPDVIGAATTEKFFLLLLHADRDREFQKECLEKMKSMSDVWPDSYSRLLKIRSDGAPPPRVQFSNNAGPESWKDERGVARSGDAAEAGATSDGNVESRNVESRLESDSELRRRGFPAGFWRALYRLFRTINSLPMETATIPGFVECSKTGYDTEGGRSLVAAESRLSSSSPHDSRNDSISV